jgi:hypothetical protein
MKAYRKKRKIMITQATSHETEKETADEDGEIYEELAPEFEDALIRRLSFAQGAWDDE